MGLAEAELIENAWLRTLEEGVHTGDVKVTVEGAQRVGTRAFAEAVVARLGQKPQVLKAAVPVAAEGTAIPTVREKVAAEKKLVGVDVYLQWQGKPDELGAALSEAGGASMQLNMIDNRGVKVWPDGFAETFCSDHWRCRFQARDGATVVHADLARLLAGLAGRGFDFVKTDNLYTWNGAPGFTAGQGQ
jgi:isocitrate dehydrogenase